MATGRYVPPGARRKETTVGPSKISEESQRPLAELAHDAGGDVFTVELRSKTHYGKCKVCIQITFNLISRNRHKQAFYTLQ